MEEAASSAVGGPTETIGLPTQPRLTDEVPPNIPDYRLIKIIGRGAFGTVWLAEETLAGLFRAIKVLDGGGRGRRARSELTNCELAGLHTYQTLAQGHPNLIQVFKTGLCQNPVSGQRPVDSGQKTQESGSAPSLTTDHRPLAATVYYVMEIADHAGGAQPHRPMDYRPQTLAALMRRGDWPASPPGKREARSQASPLDKGGPRGVDFRLPLDRTLDYAAQLLDAIEHLHKAGIHHRDIKPSNILFVGGVLKLADVGLISDEHDEHVGTSAYMPPPEQSRAREQAVPVVTEGPLSQGRPLPDGRGSDFARRPDDLYAFGKVLYEMTTGLPASAFPEWPGDLGDSPPLEKGLRSARGGSSERVGSSAPAAQPLARLRDLNNRLCHPSVGRRLASIKRLREELTSVYPSATRTYYRNQLVASGISALTIGVAIGWLATMFAFDRREWHGQAPSDGADEFQVLDWGGREFYLHRLHKPGDIRELATGTNISIRFYDLQTLLTEDGRLRVAGGYEIHETTNPVPYRVGKSGGSINQLFLVAGEEMVCVYNGQPRAHPREDGRFNGVFSLATLAKTPPGSVAVRVAYMATMSEMEARDQHLNHGESLHAETKIASMDYVLKRVPTSGPTPEWLHNARTGHHYCLTTAPMRWPEAQEEAVAAGGYLVTVNDAEENQWLLETFGKQPNGYSAKLWIGLNDAAAEGLFVWANGESVSYINWDSGAGEPNAHGSNEDYAGMYIPGSIRPLGTWIDAPATDRAVGIIERP